MRTLVQDARHGKRELGNRRLESRAVGRDHLVAAAHGADRRGDRGAARVLEALARLQQRLRADHAEAAHLLHQALRVGDDPVAADELRGNGAGVVNRDRVCEDIAVRALVGLVREVLRRRVHFDLVELLARHGGIVNSARP